MENKITLSQLPLSLKAVATGFIVTILVGYLVSLIQIYDRTNFNMQETVVHYRGDESPESDGLNLPQSFRSILSVSHVHTLSQPFIFALMGLIFSFSRRPEKFKAIVISSGFAGSLISNLTPWFIRYVSAVSVWFFPFSQVLIASCLLISSTLSLFEIWKKNA